MTDEETVREALDYQHNVTQDYRAETLDAFDRIIDHDKQATGGWSASLDGLESDLRGLRATIAGLIVERDELKHEVSRLRECRDVWKVQAESLAGVDAANEVIEGWGVDAAINIVKAHDQQATELLRQTFSFRDVPLRWGVRRDAFLNQNTPEKD